VDEQRGYRFKGLGFMKDTSNDCDLKADSSVSDEEN
jgi:hypothetical protein